MKITKFRVAYPLREEFHNNWTLKELEMPGYADASHMLISLIFYSIYHLGLEDLITFNVYGIGIKQLLFFICYISTNLSTIQLFYRCRGEKQFLPAVLPFCVNIALFWYLALTVKVGDEIWTLRFVLLAFGFKHCCLATRLIFAQQVDDNIAMQFPVIFYLDIIGLILVNMTNAQYIHILVSGFVVFAGFQYFYSLLGTVTMIAKDLRIPLLAAKKRSD